MNKEIADGIHDVQNELEKVGQDVIDTKSTTAKVDGMESKNKVSKIRLLFRSIIMATNDFMHIQDVRLIFYIFIHMPTEHIYPYAHRKKVAILSEMKLEMSNFNVNSFFDVYNK